MTDWGITRSQYQCSRCGVAFNELQEYHSALYENPQGFERKDFCQTCWSGGADDMFSFWKTQVPAKEAKAKRFVDDEVLIDFFARLENATEELKINFRYILALVLMRKKLLKFEGTRRDSSGEFLKVKVRGQDAVQEVFNPSMTPEKMEQVTVEVGRILNVQL